MRPGEIAETLARDGRLIVPVGTCEQHGRHLPLGADTLIVEHLSDDLSAEFGILRAPTIEYGVNVDHRARLSGQCVGAQEDAAPHAQRSARHVGSPPG